MRFRSIIVDDEERGIETLRLLIEKHVDDVKVVAESSKAKDAIELIENYKPEIVFLDISMPEMNGFELLENLEWKNFNLIFTTAHREHALKALKLSATDYLLKPIDHRDLRLAVDRIKQVRDTQQDTLSAANYDSLNNIRQYFVTRLGINSKEGIEYLDTKEIIILESRSNYTKVFLSDGRTLTTPKGLGEFDLQLCQDNRHFMRVHHSFVINLHKVLRYIKEDDDIVMAGNQKIPLSKSRRESFFRWMGL